MQSNLLQVDEIQPYQNIYNDNLVRIGVINNNLFHAIMVGYSNRYLKSTLDKRIETVKIIRECAANSFTKQCSEEIQSHVFITKEFLKIITDPSCDFSMIHSIDDKNLCKLLSEIITSDKFLTDITLNKPNIEQLTELVQLNMKLMLKHLDNFRIEFFTTQMITFVNDIWIEAKIRSFNSMKFYLKDSPENISDEFIPFISNVLNVDIYVLRDGKLKSTNNYKNRRSLIIDQISDNKYAAIGKRLYSSDIEWSFEYDYNIIQKINPNKHFQRSPMIIEDKIEVELTDEIEK